MLTKIRARIRYEIGARWHDNQAVQQFLCGFRGHGEPVWYSSGYEPDMTCRRCGLDMDRGRTSRAFEAGMTVAMIPSLSHRGFRRRGGNE